MKYSAIALALITSTFFAGCSDENSAPSAVIASGSPAVEKLVVGPDLPLEIKGLPFELRGKCAIDSVNTPQPGEIITISRADGMRVDGWAFDEKHGDVPPVIVLQLAKGEDRYHALLSRHGGRDDLVQVFGPAELSDAGYAGEVDISSLPTGLYDILVIQRGDEKNMVCPTYRKLALND